MSRRKTPPTPAELHAAIIAAAEAIDFDRWHNRLYRLADQVQAHGRMPECAASVRQVANVMEDCYRKLIWVATCNKPDAPPVPGAGAPLNPLEAAEQLMRLEKKRET